MGPCRVPPQQDALQGSGVPGAAPLALTPLGFWAPSLLPAHPSSFRDESFWAENSSQVIFQMFSGLAQRCCSESFKMANNESTVRLKLAEYAWKLCLQQSYTICKNFIILFSGLKKQTNNTNKKNPTHNFLLGKIYTCFARVTDVSVKFIKQNSAVTHI